jgi:lipopolysaccharide export system permease protein
MSALQGYYFRQILGPLAAILVGLALVAILTQSLTQLDIIVDERRSGLVFAWVTVLALPQLIGLILPLALFFAVVYAINRLHGDSEIVVASAAGMSNAQIISPVLKLATLVAIAHLGITTLVQPAAFREMRAVVNDVRNDLAASLVREGAFTTPAKGLTIYARKTEVGGAMRDLLIHDGRKQERETTFTAKAGWVAMVGGAPALIMRDGQIQQPKANGAIDVLDFNQYVLELGAFFGADEVYMLKSSDRYLGELFRPDPTSFFDIDNADAFIAEAHARLTAPLLNIAMALIALAALLTGDFRRNGYGRRIAQASAIALMVRLVALGVQAACVDNPALNPMQYAFPILVSAAAAFALIRARPKQSPSPAVALIRSPA